VQPQSTWDYKGQNTFGSFLKKGRIRRRMSRHGLAVVSGIQERRLEAIELNQSPPSYRDIKRLAIVLEIPEQELLEVAGCIKREEGA
jgi:transcriptional regulator with XRE-family HTH domain